MFGGGGCFGVGDRGGGEFQSFSFQGGESLMGNRSYIFSMEPPSGTQYVGVMPSVLQYI
jgi:hypothetical protein